MRRNDSDPKTNHHDPCTCNGWMDEMMMMQWMDEGDDDDTIDEWMRWIKEMMMRWMDEGDDDDVIDG